MGRFSMCGRLRIAAGGLLILGGLYVFFLAPYIASARLSAQKECAAAHTQLARLASYRRADETETARLDLRRSTYSDALPDILGVAPQPPLSADALTVLPIELSFHGNYYAVLDFLHALTEGARAVRLGDMEIKADEGILHCVLIVEIASTVQARDKNLP